MLLWLSLGKYCELLDISFKDFLVHAVPAYLALKIKFDMQNKNLLFALISYFNRK